MDKVTWGKSEGKWVISQLPSKAINRGGGELIWSTPPTTQKHPTSIERERERRRERKEREKEEKREKVRKRGRSCKIGSALSLKGILGCYILDTMLKLIFSMI